MAIWNLKQDESLRNLKEAAVMRYLEGEDLIRTGSPVGAVYLLGYAAEIWLKTAFFSYLPETEDLESHIKRIKRDERESSTGAFKPSLAKQYEAEFMMDDLHSPRFWADLLIRMRAIEGKNLPLDLALELSVRMNRLHLNWWTGLRYQDIHPDFEYVYDVWDDVTWIYRNLGKIEWR